MDDCVWMYSSWKQEGDLTLEWIQKTEAFLDRAFSKVKGGSCTWCPCTKCGNTHRQTREDMHRQTRIDKHDNIFAIMDLRETVPGGPTMVKAIV